MDSTTLAKAMGNTPGVNYGDLLASYLGAMRAAQITTVRRAAMFAAQIGHESAGLRYMEEIADGSAYEGRTDLGNIYPGDGRRFKGRGPIQLTGRANYRAFTRWARAQNLATFDFEAEPHRLSDPRWGFLAAAYYWTVARPDINALSDAGDLLTVTRRINGGTNGLDDRRARYHRALALGVDLLPGGTMPAREKVLPYPRADVRQDTYYNCGPASTQTVIRSATGRLMPESGLAREMGTSTNGTDYIGLIAPVLNRHLPAGKYATVYMPNDPPTRAQSDRLWTDLTNSIDAGFGVIANIVAPPSNYPRASYTSTISPAYGGGTVYHYIAVMGYAVDRSGARHVWIADSGFAPYGYWMTFTQLSTLIPPKGYAYSTARPKRAPAHRKESNMSVIGRIKSIINPSKSFDAETSLAIIDATSWETRELLKEIARKQGLNPEKIITDAINADRKGAK